MEERETMRVKLKLKNRNRYSKTSEQQLNALRTVMSLIHSNDLLCYTGDQQSNEYKVKGLSFDHELDTLEIILQKHRAG